MNMVKYIKNLKNNELKKEYNQLNESIHTIGCYSINDVKLFSLVQMEMEDRKLM